MVEKSAIAHPKRKEFYVGMDFCTLGQHIEKFIPISLKDKYGEKLKNFLFSVGLMQWIKKRLRE